MTTQQNVKPNHFNDIQKRIDEIKQSLIHFNTPRVKPKYFNDIQERIDELRKSL